MDLDERYLQTCHRGKGKYGFSSLVIHVFDKLESDVLVQQYVIDSSAELGYLVANALLSVEVMPSVQWSCVKCLVAIVSFNVSPRASDRC